MALCDDLGLLVGHLTHTAGRYTDLIELRRRRRPMNLAAEMQWDLLPPLSFASPDLAIAGLLEPAYFVAGDAFDYSLNGDILGFAIIDAMGHGVSSTLASTLALGAFRYGRRRNLDLTGHRRAHRRRGGRSSSTARASSPAIWPGSTWPPATCAGSTPATRRRC